MQTSPATYLPVTRSTTAVNHRDSTPISHPPMSIQNTGRAMSTPALSVSIPPTKPKKQTRFVLKDGDLVPEEEAESDEETDASSICHSPGWDDLSGAKRKEKKRKAKERKKEKEKAEAKARTEAKHAEKVKNRLSKAPPTNNRLSKMGIVMDRSVPSPAVQALPEIKEHKEDGKRGSAEPASRGSVEVGLKSFIQATQAIPVPWRTSHGTPTQTTPTLGAPSLQPVSAGDGFIGGLKLRMAEEAEVLERIRKQSLTDENPKTVPKAEKTDLRLSQLKSRDKKAPNRERDSRPEIPELMDQEEVRTPQQWESIHEQAAKLLRGPETFQNTADDIPKTDRNARKRLKTYPPTSSYFAMDAASTRRDSSANSRTSSRPRTSEDKGSQGRRASSAFSSGGKSSNTRDTSTERPDAGYVRNQRKQSKDRAVNGLEDEQRVWGAVSDSVRPESRGRRTSWNSIISRNHHPSTEAPSTIKSPKAQNGHISKVTSNGPAIADSPIPLPIPQDEKSPTSPVESSLLKRRASSKNSNVAGLKGLKNAARAAFSRNSSAVTSPTESLPNPNEGAAPKTASPRLTKKGSQISIALDSDARRISKAERFFGQPVSTAVYEETRDFRPKSSGPGSNQSIPAQAPAPAPAPQSKGPDILEKASGMSTPAVKDIKGHSHSASVTDSSEEYSYDEYSNITTPTASIPQSKKDYFVPTPAQDFVFKKMTGVPNGPKAPNPPSNASSQIRQSSLPEPSALSDPSTSNHSRNTSTSTTELSRQPSLSRSISNPELQAQAVQQADLSFLPALKHQALTKPLPKDKPDIKGKGKQIAPKPTALLKSSPLAAPPAPTVTNSISPTSPMSSQYLHQARLSMPRQPSRFPSTPSPTSGGPDPIAKMFVVCCSCKYFHDMPSKIYECMARAESVVEDKDLGVRGVVSTSVRCPWCGHGMTSACCAGWAAVVVLRERLH
jgi:hypothetical protein